MLNKPIGVVSATRDDKDKTVIDLINFPGRKEDLFPVGRLDKETTGLLIITMMENLLMILFLLKTCI